MLCFLVNPTSSSGGGNLIWQQIEGCLKKENAEYKCYPLTRPGEATAVARSLTSGEEENTIVVVGGDGTINECINGIVNFDRCILGCIPTGSGNDFIRGMRLPPKPEDAVHMILHSKNLREVNVGKVIQQDAAKTDSPALRKVSRFIVSSGIGYDAAICYEASRSRLKSMLNRLKLGKLIYTVTALRMLIAMKPLHMRILVDDRQLLSFDRTFFAVAMNTAFEGGGYCFCPDADPTDDLLEIMIAEGIPKPLVLGMMPLAMKGKHTHLRGIHLLRCKKAVIRIDEENEPACVHTDGEHAGFSRKITWSLSDKKLRVIVL